MIFYLPDSIRNSGSFDIGLATACRQGVAIGGKAITECKNGLISCIRSISNSLESLTRPLFHRAAKYNLSSPATTPDDTSVTLTKVCWSINNIPVERIAQICQAVISIMQNNRDEVSDMFRISLASGKAEQLNTELQQDPRFVSRINSGEVTPCEVSVMAKLWCDGIMDGRQFTTAEAQQLIENKSDSEFVQRALANKLGQKSAKMGEDWHKLMAIFSLFNAYRDICRNDGANEPGSLKKYNENALSTCVSPRFFDITDAGKATVDDIANNVTLGKKAFLTLLTTCN